MKTLTDKQRRAVAIIIEQITAESKGEASVKHSDDAQNDKISEDSEETVGDVLETLTDKQRKVVVDLVGEATKKELEDSEGGSEMKHNVFEGSENT